MTGLVRTAVLGVCTFSVACVARGDEPLAGRVAVSSASSGRWSAPATWEGGRVPLTGDTVKIREGHTVVYDMNSDRIVRSVHIAGTLTFAPDLDTRLDAGLIRIEAGDGVDEEGFECDAHSVETDSQRPRAELLVGTPDRPIEATHSALIRLHYIEGMNKDSCPAIVCCGGRMEFHGAEMSRTWVKLGATARTGDNEITLSEPVTGWRTGDRVIITATTRQNKQKKTFKPSVRDSTQTEEHQIAAVDGVKLTLDAPLAFDHIGDGGYRGDVANLSRNVVVESAEAGGVRGHTMYHRGSAGAISYTEFRHLGKQGALGRYSLHFHLVGDTMRGTSVIGASIWDSGNRWLTIHGTNYLIVRDCVGYQSVGHGFFLEDGTEVLNVLDRNLAVQAFSGNPLPKQVIPFDKNDGSGFWWANSRNTFTRNVAAECDEYGYFFQAAKTAEFDPVRSVAQPDGSRHRVDIRTLPFVRFDDNEAHCQRRHAFNLGGGVPFGEPNVDGVGPDGQHPFIIRNFKAWNVHWAIHPVAPSVLLERLDVHDAEYGVWRPVYRGHVYHQIHMDQVPDNTQYAFADGPPPLTNGTETSSLETVDDLPPATVITRVLRISPGELLVRGTTSDNGTVTRVIVNGHAARAVAPNFAQWEVAIDTAELREVIAYSEDDSHNVENSPHRVPVSAK
jgi:hypothetical protein